MPVALALRSQFSTPELPAAVSQHLTVMPERSGTIIQTHIFTNSGQKTWQKSFPHLYKDPLSDKNPATALKPCGKDPPKPY